MEATSDELIWSIAINLKKARKQHEMTQATLASVACIDLSYVQRVERGRQNLTIRTLARIAAALGVDVQSLLEPCGLEERRLYDRRGKGRGDQGRRAPPVPVDEGSTPPTAKAH